MNFLELRKAEVQLRRITIPRRWVNKGKKKGRGPVLQDPGLITLPPSLEESGTLPSAVKRCYFGLITPQVAGMVASWGSEGSSSLLPAALKSYLPLSLRSTPCWTMAFLPKFFATLADTMRVRSYSTVPLALATGKRSTARPLLGLVSPVVVKETWIGP